MNLRLLALAALLALGAGCLNNVAAPSTPTGTNQTTGTNMTMTPQAVTVTVGESVGSVPPSAMLYTISPAKLELHVGVPVNLTLKNSGQNSHDLVIEGIDGAKVPATPGGQSKTIEFTPMKAGEYKMYCTIGGGTPLAHRDNGMAGTVTVS
jgi:uncharacterized cupredoxin-like copper-binding protein